MSNTKLLRDRVIPADNGPTAINSALRLKPQAVAAPAWGRRELFGLVAATALSPRPPCPTEKGFLPIARQPNDLAARTMKAVQEKFASFKPYPHCPSAEQQRGLEENAIALMAMADSNSILKRHLYLSSLAPGIGKTTVNSEFVKLLMASAERRHRDVGVLYLLSRCNEIHDLVAEMKQEMNLSEDDYSVAVTDSTESCKVVQRLGNPNANDARVLFITQKNIEVRAKSGRSFAEMTEFYFRGQPRLVRIWDEAILPAEITTLDQYDIPRLYGALSKANHLQVLQMLEEFVEKLKAQGDQAIVSVPDIADQSLSSLEAQNLFRHPEDRETVRKLWELSGQCVRLRKEGPSHVILTYEDQLPFDLGPMLVTDASGGLREVYKLWRNDRGGLCDLYSPPKSYRGLTIHHWDRASGKNGTYKAASKEWKEIARKVAATIERIPPNEKVLIVEFKPGQLVADFGKEIKKLLSGDQMARVECIHYGIHTSTNKYRDYKYVLVCGLLLYPLSQNDAYAGSSKGLHPLVPALDSEVRSVRRGEAKHNLFQAAARGNIRVSEGDGCPPGNHIYVIFSSRVMPEAILEETFPGATVVPWHRQLDEKEQQLMHVLSNGGRGGSFKKGTLIEQISSTPPTLRRLLRRIAADMAVKGQPLKVSRREVVVPCSAPE